MANLISKVKKYLEQQGIDNVDFYNDVRVAKNGDVQEIELWNLDIPQPTQAELDALETEATTLENNAKIDAKRQTEYLSWQEQFEMIYKDQKNGTTTYKDHCDKVRSDNPKG